MFKTFRVAGLAAAIATLCLHAPAAAAQTAPAAPFAPAASIVPPANAAPQGLASALTPLAPVDVNIQNPSTNPAPATTNVQPANAVSPAPATAAPAVVTPSAPVAQPAVVTRTPVRRSLDDLVAEHAGSETTDAQFECLASAVYFESRGEPLEGQLAVAEVILNRVSSGRFRSTICEVVTQPSQFSFVRRGRIPAAPRSSAAWQRAVAIAHIALQNLHDVTGDNSLFFHATYVSPSWGRSSSRIARIGRHIFYR